eukprot:TRINITY_DN18126_c0_g2_i1.p1 TRINITY_DN18126_c0_g2~~TRINITY_DN18126_c0_g2_i1.p1  ORF type:complete len:116 (-),score=25.87 TRINITY_DN18126_c0_g2_i1:5-352(-)
MRCNTNHSGLSGPQGELKYTFLISLLAVLLMMALNMAAVAARRRRAQNQAPTDSPSSLTVLLPLYSGLLVSLTLALGLASANTLAAIMRDTVPPCWTETVVSNALLTPHLSLIHI